MGQRLNILTIDFETYYAVDFSLTRLTTEEYVYELTTRGIKTYIKDLEDALLDMASESNESFVTEAGDVEKWAGKGIDNNKLTQDLQEYIQKLKDHVNS